MKRHQAENLKPWPKLKNEGRVIETALFNAVRSDMAAPGGLCGPFTQLVEQLTFNQVVDGSSSSELSNQIKALGQI